MKYYVITKYADGAVDRTVYPRDERSALELKASFDAYQDLDGATHWLEPEDTCAVAGRPLPREVRA